MSPPNPPPGDLARDPAARTIREALALADLAAVTAVTIGPGGVDILSRGLLALAERARRALMEGVGVEDLLWVLRKELDD